jgi:hypothetical protein
MKLKLTHWLLTGIGAALGALSLGAAEPLSLPNAVFSIGTTTTNAQGVPWAYLLWQPTEPNALTGRKLAVYAKPGAADANVNYERRTITQRQTDPLVIQSLLNRAVNLGEDLTQLGTRVDALFSAAVPKASLSLPEKVSAIIRGAESDPKLLANLLFLGRLHPSLNLCLGHAWAEPVTPGRTTFEVRDYDFATSADLGVIGRVTVDSSAPIVLPAPGRPAQFNEASAKGDLNIKLRWATPDALREVGLLQHGFNVYRMTKAFAESSNYHNIPPLRADLPRLVADGQARRINESPVTVNRLHDAFSVLDFQNDPTWYIADDNHRYDRNTPFERGFSNGEQFYYFVTARDLLGRDGVLSAAGLALACDRLPPDAPEGVQVENHYTFSNGVSNQVLKVTWKQAPNTSDVVAAYHVYRWTNATDAAKYGVTNAAVNHIAGPILHLPGQATASYLDNGAGAPHAPDDYNKTYWYTIRAVDLGACSNNLSPNSAPAFGVLRNRTAPGETIGDLGILCCRPGGRTDKDYFVTDVTATDTNLAYYRFTVARTNAGLGHAEFYFTRGNLETNLIARLAFPAGLGPIVLDWTTNRASAGAGFHRTFVRVIAKDGKESDLIELSNQSLPGSGSRHLINAVAYLHCQKVRVRPSSPFGGLADDCVHTPVNPDDGQTIEPPVVIFLPAQGSKEFRVYRRVNYGPLTLIKQGPITNDPPTEMEVADPNPPANAAWICYYVQTLDEHGNAGPLTQISDCLRYKFPNPKPLLSPLTGDGDETNPRMTITWFCPPFGVERFEVFIGAGSGSLPANIGGGLTQVSPLPVTRWVRPPGYLIQVPREFYVYRTPRVGLQFGDGGFFQTTVNIELSKNYLVFVNPVGLDGNPDPEESNSKTEKFTWTVPVVQGPQVPWPARPLPAVSTNSVPDWVRPTFINNPNITTNFVGVGLIVGTVPGAGRQRPDVGKAAVLDNTANPLNSVAASSAGGRLFPLVVYRFQETNQYFPRVSGDLTQVTPMMENIAYTVGNDATFGPSALIFDPFIDIYQASLLNVPGLGGGATSRNAIVLLDTQPVVKGARYRYLLVRFGDNREIVEVIPTAPVDIL